MADVTSDKEPMGKAILTLGVIGLKHLPALIDNLVGNPAKT